jgi:CPA1 family monovalent cation:H+ antiporter
VSLSREIILFVFVPPLIFESALNLDNKLLLRTLVPALVLAGPGLLLSAAIVGGIPVVANSPVVGDALLLAL